MAADLPTQENTQNLVAWCNTRIAQDERKFLHTHWGIISPYSKLYARSGEIYATRLQHADNKSQALCLAFVLITGDYFAFLPR